MPAAIPFIIPLLLHPKTRKRPEPRDGNPPRKLKLAYELK